MSGYCPDCGNQQCICEEIERRNNMSYREDFEKENGKYFSNESKFYYSFGNDYTYWLESKLSEKDKEIEELKKDKWISVKDRLPEPMTRIIYYNTVSRDDDPIKIGYCGHKEWFAGITHWKLPNPPEEL